MLGFVGTLLAIGLVVGFVARWIVPGPDRISPVRTVLLGIAGSLVGGLLAFWIFGGDSGQGIDWAAGLLGAVTATVLLLIGDNYLTGRKDQITT
jgi:uncharacterized membrane protein YeaQ/YmgE (transglycosylase-associated protein family)